MFKQKTWFWKRRSRLYIGSQEMTTSFNKFKGSVIAIIFGLIIAAFVIIASGQNPFTYFQLLLTFAFTSFPNNNWDNTLVWWAIYIVAGLALVVCFRAGMFNIGVAGQMLAAGAVILTIGIRYDLSQPLALFLALIAGMAAATLVAVTTALLKVFFNVHEVVTAILLNWTIWYVIKWFFITVSKDLYDSGQGTSMRLKDGMIMAINGYNCILPLVLAGILVLVVWFALKKTTLGYKMRTVGLNRFAALYGGISDKRYAVIAFALSGMLAGVMAFIYYVGKNPSISFLSDDLPTIGFDSIAVALVGQINAFGVVGAAFLWGLIKSGGSIGTVLELPTATGDIIFGVIIYSAACAILLMHFQPLKFIIRYCNIYFHKTTRASANKHVKTMWQYIGNSFKLHKLYRGQHKQLKLTMRRTVKTGDINNINDIDAKIKQLVQTKNEKVVNFARFRQEGKSFNHYVSAQYALLWTRGKIGKWNSVQEQKKAVYGDSLNDYIKARNTYETAIYQQKQQLAQQLALLKQEKQALIKLQTKVVKPATASEKMQSKKEVTNVNEKTKQLKNQFKAQMIVAKKEFTRDFNKLLKNEQQIINKIKPQMS